MIPKDTIEKITEAANVYDVISDFYDLRRDGPSGWTCLCPFHADRHIGSFKISEAKNHFHCFSCGASGGPVEFLMRHEGMSYPDAIRWLGRKYGYMIEDNGHAPLKEPKKCKPHEPAKPMQMMTIDKTMLDRTLVANKNASGITINDDDLLVKWITHGINWDGAQRKRIPIMLRNYKIGHGKKGHTIFWQIDENGQIRTGKMMLYKPDGHRDKETPYNFDWIHAAIIRAGMVDPMEYQYDTCYFGQHLIDLVPDATINLVESEKTALLMAIAYGDMRRSIWIATGGLQFFNERKLRPFIEKKRQIIAYPDKDGVEEWRKRAEEIGYSGLRINTDILKDYWTEADGPKADIADIIARMLNSSPIYTALERAIKENPSIHELIDKFDLIEVKQNGNQEGQARV